MNGSGLQPRAEHGQFETTPGTGGLMTSLIGFRKVLQFELRVF